ncbi:hypothetical protein F4815DRAFT_279405 [Daldinia loculata]|nr:hypothetical protein F4815DRAFT_279405 [Daldinia loculata]
MCLEIYVHCTTPEHDTRHLSTLNPVTGYTVYSPWQEPHSKICEHPHIIEQIDINQHCLWHPGCCRLEHHRRCWSDNCSMWSTYHHFVDEQNGEAKDISFLGMYMGHNPTNLLIAGWLFKAGAEVEVSKHHLRNSPIIIEGSSYAAGLANAEWLRRRLYEIYNKAKECLAQFAILWDMNSGPGALPPRPGLEADPRLNEFVSSLLCLRVADSGQFLDTSTVSWPHYIQLWDKFRAGVVPLRDDPYSVPWIAGASRVESDPDSVGYKVKLDEGDKVYNVEALVGHDPPHVVRRDVQRYKVRWEGDWEEDKETWVRVIDINPELIDAYWEKFNAENP